MSVADDNSDCEDADKEEGDMDSSIKDLEFRLTHDLDKLVESTNKTRSFTLRDIVLLKVRSPLLLWTLP